MSFTIAAPGDWRFRSITWTTLIIVALQILLVLAGQIGISVPALNQVTGFVFLSFVPGLLLFRILKIHHVNLTESIAYIVGLSIASIMFFGVMINFILPVFNVPNPLTPLYTLIVISFGILALLGTAYIRDKNHTGLQTDSTIYHFSTLQVLLLIFVLLLTILAVILINSFRNNILLIVCLMIIAVLLILAIYHKVITPSHYPILIFTISLCLLYQTTLLSPYLVGSDIYTEYQFYHNVVQSGHWDPSIRHPVNACLSIVMLAPVYTYMMQIDGIWMFKAVYPILFSVVPVILYRFFRIQVGQDRALLASFLFMIIPTFSLEMISLCRQQIAEIFLGLFILLIVDRRVNKGAKLLLVILSTGGIIVSHYSLGFISVIYLGSLLALVFIMRSQLFIRLWNRLISISGGAKLSGSDSYFNYLPWRILYIPVLLYLVVGFIWYTFIASGINLDFLNGLLRINASAITQGLSNITTGVSTAASFLQFSQRDALVQTALGLDFLGASWQGKIFRILQYSVQIFIIIGCFRLLFRPSGTKFRTEYIALCITSILLLAACIFIKEFAEALNTTRWYHLAMITLAPFLILGGETAWNSAKSLFVRLKKKVSISPPVNSGGIKFVTLILLVPYFIFTSGVIYEITDHDMVNKVDTPYSIALSSYRLDLAGVFYQRDYAAGAWLVKSSGGDRIICDTRSHRSLLLNQTNNTITIIRGDLQSSSGDKLFLNEWNTKSGTVAVETGPGQRRYVDLNSLEGIKNILRSGDAIYTNGGAKIWIAR